MNNISNRLLKIAKEIQAVEFTTRQNFEEYMELHPDADPASHTIKPTLKDVIREKKEKVKQKTREEVDKLKEQGLKEYSRDVNNRVKEKTRNWSDENKRFFNGGELPNSEERRSFGKAIKDKSKAILKMVKVGFKEKAQDLKDAGVGLLQMATGNQMQEINKKAVKKLAINIAKSAADITITGGLGIAVTPIIKFAQNLASDSVNGFSATRGLKALVFAKGKKEKEMTEDEPIEEFILFFADYITNKQFKPETWAKLIDASDYDFTK